MSASSRARQADSLQPICKTPLWLREAQTPRRRWGLSGGFGPAWTEAGQRKHLQKDPSDIPVLSTACGLAVLQEMGIACIAPG